MDKSSSFEILDPNISLLSISAEAEETEDDCDSDDNNSDNDDGNCDENSEEEQMCDADEDDADDDYTDDDDTDDDGTVDGNNRIYRNLASTLFHPDLKISKYEILLLVSQLVTKHRITDKAVNDLLKALNLIAGFDSIPTSTYKFQKLFKHKSVQPKLHYYCSYCKASIEENETNTQHVCLECKNFVDLSYKNSFTTFSIKKQIVYHIENNKNNIFCNNSNTDNPHYIDDVNKGTFYRKLRSDNIIQPNKTVTLMINTDGVQLINSKATQFWPVLAIINELNPKVRFKSRNKIIAGLWYDSTPPDMSLYLWPIIEELNQLSKSGVTIRRNGIKEKIKVIVILCCCDSPAKSKDEKYDFFYFK